MSARILATFPAILPHLFTVTVRFADTDAMGHVNNARFLTYCESARIAFWEAATGEPMALPTHGAGESLILADIQVTFRTPAFFGEELTVESRIGRIGRHQLHPGASDHGGDVRSRRSAPGRDGCGDPCRVRLRAARPRAVPDELVGRLEAWEGRSLRG